MAWSLAKEDISNVRKILKEKLDFILDWYSVSMMKDKLDNDLIKIQNEETNKKK